MAALLIWAALFMLPSPALSADTGSEQGSGPDIVALIVPLDTNDVGFNVLISSVLDLRFTPMGPSLDIQTVPPSEGGPQKNDPLIEQAKKTGAAAVLICRYSVASGQMTSTMDWYDMQEGTHAAVLEKKAQLDLDLDTYIRGLLDSLLTQVQDRIDQIAARRQETKAVAAAAAAAAAVAQSGKETPPATAAQKATAIPAEAARPTIEAAEGTTPRRLLLSTGIAPFIPIGAASSSISLGYMSSFMGDFSFIVPSGQIGLGLSLGVISFTAQGTAGSFTSFLLPMGLDARYVLGVGSVAGVLFHVTGGAAVLFVSSDTRGTMAKTLPFLRGGIGLELFFSKMVGVVLDVGYEVYFEMPNLIMGVSPSLNVSLRL